MCSYRIGTVCQVITDKGRVGNDLRRGILGNFVVPDRDGPYAVELSLELSLARSHLLSQIQDEMVDGLDIVDVGEDGDGSRDVNRA